MTYLRLAPLLVLAILCAAGCSIDEPEHVCPGVTIVTGNKDETIGVAMWVPDSVAVPGSATVVMLLRKPGPISWITLPAETEWRQDGVAAIYLGGKP